MGIRVTLSSKALSKLICPQPWKGGCYYNPHFTDEETISGRAGIWTHLHFCAEPGWGLSVVEAMREHSWDPGAEERLGKGLRNWPYNSRKDVRGSRQLPQSQLLNDQVTVNRYIRGEHSLR